MLKNYINKIPSNIRFLIGVYLTGILFFTVFRGILLFTNLKEIVRVPEASSYLLKSFLIGFRFDTVISCYILIIPFLILFILALIKKQPKSVVAGLTVFLILFYSIAFLISSIDIPYYNHFGSRLSSAALAWTNTPGFMIKMIFGEYSYWIYIIPFLVICMIFSKIIIRLKSHINSAEEPLGNKRIIILISFLIIAVCLFAGSRGRLALKSPIRIGTAFISEYSIVNNLGLNPSFTFFKSYLEDLKPENQSIHLMDDEKAILLAKNFLNIPKNNGFNSPIAREVLFNQQPIKANVVIVIMESTSTFKMGHFGGPKLTPVLDSLKKVSHSFENFYSAGIHTFNGIYSTLFSFPALLKQQPLNFLSNKQFTGIGNTLKKNGYNTVYFTTHDEQFDNVGGFLSFNGYDKIYSEKDYPVEKSLSALGVPDHYLFEYSIPVLNKLHESNKPFLSVFMTASDHGPWVIPTDIDFKPGSKEKEQKGTEYADWSIGHFLREASNQAWFDNTLFVFLGDHGINLGHTYDMPLSFHHVPCLFYSPKFITEPKRSNSLGGQIDIFPTIMGILKIPFINNTLGIDLFQEKRPFMYFSADDKIGCLDEKYYFIYRMEEGRSTLYKYEDLSIENHYYRLSQKVDSMRNYAFSMMQTTQWILKNEKFIEQRK